MPENREGFGALAGAKVDHSLGSGRKTRAPTKEIKRKTAMAVVLAKVDHSLGSGRKGRNHNMGWA